VAGVGWTYAAALLATAVGSLILSLIGASSAGLVFATCVGAPAVVLTYLGHEGKAVPDGAGGIRIERYSPGRLVLAAAVVSSLIAILFVVQLHDQAEAVRAAVSKGIENFPQLSEQKPTPENIAEITDILLKLLPGGVAIMIMTVALLNLWLAARIARASGQLNLPWPDLAAMRLPRSTPLIFAAALVASSTLTGHAGSVAVGVAGAFFIAQLLLGLAVIHYVTRGKSWRPFALWGTYIGLILASVWVAVPIIILGLIETIFSLRQPPAAGGSAV
jgi:hypothetical protein